MVGVPGRSKACHNCRQRRIRCDGQKPKCANCAKSNRLCMGYQRQHAFILSRDTVLFGSNAAAQNSASLTGEDGSGLVMFSRWRINQDKPSPQSSNASASQEQTLTTSPPPVTPPPSLPQSPGSRSAFRQQLIELYITSTFPEEVIVTARTAIKRHSWIIQVADLPGMDPPLENAMLALCTAALARGEGAGSGRCEPLLRESLSLYTSGLGALHRALLDPVKRAEEQSIAATMALTMYELQQCPSRTSEGYFSHHVGAMKLLEMRGPDALSSGLTHSLFKAIRLHNSFHGLRTRVATFLVQPEWKEKPWGAGFPRGPYDQLIDIFLQLPGVLERNDAMSAQLDAPESPRAPDAPAQRLRKLRAFFPAALDLLRDCFRLDAELAAWFAGFSGSVAGPLYWPELTTMPPGAAERLRPERGRVFPVAFHFPAFVVAQNMVVYWAAQLVLHVYIVEKLDKIAELAAEMAELARGSPCVCRGAPQQPGEEEDEEDEEMEGEEEVEALPSSPAFSSPSSSSSSSPSSKKPSRPPSRTPPPPQPRICPRHFRPEQHLPPLGARADWARTSARYICQSAEYFFGERMRKVGPSILFAPLVIVRECLTYATHGDWAAELAWIHEVLDRIRARGNELAGYI